MASKREILEDKTVKELRDMARDKDLSGYSKMRKNELIELISDNYSEEEIVDASEKKTENEEREEKGKDEGSEEGPVEERDVPVESFEISKEEETTEIQKTGEDMEEEIPVEILAGAGILVIVIIVLITVFFL